MPRRTGTSSSSPEERSPHRSRRASSSSHRRRERPPSTSDDLVSLADLWPPWRDRWVLHEDLDLVIVDKPAGVPTHAPSPERTDDAHTRVGAWLRARGNARDVY